MAKARFLQGIKRKSSDTVEPLWAVRRGDIDEPIIFDDSSPPRPAPEVIDNPPPSRSAPEVIDLTGDDSDDEALNENDIYARLVI
jgi:hypothetical protein